MPQEEKKTQPNQAPLKDIPQQTPKPSVGQVKSSILSPLRTLKSDAIDAIKNRGQTLTKIVLAEQKKRQAQKIEKKKKFQWNILLVIGSIVLVLAGIGLTLFALFSRGEESPIPQPSFVQGIIFAEQNRKIEFERLSREKIELVFTGDILNANIPINNIRGFYFTKFVEVELGEGTTNQEQLIGAREFLMLLRSNMSESLIRSFNNDFLLGFHSFIGNQPFFILKTDAFDNTFSGMLKWEKTMLTDLASLFSISVTNKRLFNKPFEDRVVNNHDTRTLIDENGNLVLFYSFINKNTLIITTHKTTFDELIKRLQAPRQVTR